MTDTTTTTLDTTTIEATLANLRHQLTALDAEKVRREAEATVSRVVQQESALEGRIITITRSCGAVARLDHLIAVETTWKEFLVGARQTLCGELLAFPKRIYDPIEKGKQENVVRSVRSIDFVLMTGDGWTLNNLRLGQLMREAGYREGPRIENQVCGALPWYGSLPEVEQRLKALQAQHADEQYRLDTALLSDEERSARDAARREKFNATPQRKTRGDGSQYDVYPDGSRVEVTT